MAIVGPLGLLKLIREVSVGEIRKQADQVPRVVLCGTPEERERLRELLLAGSTEETDRARLAQALAEIGVPLDGNEVVQSLSGQALFTMAAPDDALRRLKVPIYQVTDAESLRQAARQVAEQAQDGLVGLGRHVPALRPAVSERLTAATSAANAEIGLISALPGVAPLTQVLLPPAAMADIVLLTKNQIMLVLKIAAVYGKPVEVTARLWELAPVVGGAFGWRQLAREVVGVVPGGVGAAAKATIAYAGTFTVGRTAQLFHARGVHVSLAEEKRIYTEALERAREVVASLMARLRRTRPEGDGKEEEQDADGGNAPTAAPGASDAPSGSDASPRRGG